MTTAVFAITTPRGDGFEQHASLGALRAENRALQAELDQLQPVVGAAVLVATAFRLRDHEALISALRMLVRAMCVFEERQARV